MLDFKRLGSPSLWKSGPLFSTGPKEVELLVRELRLNLRSRRRDLRVPVLAIR